MTRGPHWVAQVRVYLRLSLAEGSEVLVTDFNNLTLNPPAPLPTPPFEVSPPQLRGDQSEDEEDWSYRRRREQRPGPAPPLLRRRGVRTVQSQLRRDRLLRRLLRAERWPVSVAPGGGAGASGHPGESVFACDFLLVSNKVCVFFSLYAVRQRNSDRQESEGRQGKCWRRLGLRLETGGNWSARRVSPQSSTWARGLEPGLA